MAALTGLRRCHTLAGGLLYSSTQRPITLWTLRLLAWLAPLTGLTELELGPFSNSSLGLLSALMSLQRLGLFSASLDGEGIEALRSLPLLTRLQLDDLQVLGDQYSQLTGAGFPHLKELCVGTGPWHARVCARSLLQLLGPDCKLADLYSNMHSLWWLEKARKPWMQPGMCWVRAGLMVARGPWLWASTNGCVYDDDDDEEVGMLGFR